MGPTTEIQKCSAARALRWYFNVDHHHLPTRDWTGFVQDASFFEHPLGPHMAPWTSEPEIWKPEHIADMTSNQMDRLTVDGLIQAFGCSQRNPIANRCRQRQICFATRSCLFVIWVMRELRGARPMREFKWKMFDIFLGLRHAEAWKKFARSWEKASQSLNTIFRECSYVWRKLPYS